MRHEFEKKKRHSQTEKWGYILHFVKKYFLNQVWKLGTMWSKELNWSFSISFLFKMYSFYLFILNLVLAMWLFPGMIIGAQRGLGLSGCGLTRKMGQVLGWSWASLSVVGPFSLVIVFYLWGLWTFFFTWAPKSNLIRIGLWIFWSNLIRHGLRSDPIDVELLD